MYLNPDFELRTFYELWCKITVAGEITYTALFYRRECFDRVMQDQAHEAYMTIKATPGQSWKFEVQIEEDECPEDRRIVESIPKMFTEAYMYQEGFDMLQEYLQGASGVLEKNDELGQMIFAMDIEELHS